MQPATPRVPDVSNNGLLKPPPHPSFSPPSNIINLVTPPPQTSPSQLLTPPTTVFRLPPPPSRELVPTIFRSADTPPPPKGEGPAISALPEYIKVSYAESRESATGCLLTTEQKAQEAHTARWADDETSAPDGPQTTAHDATAETMFSRPKDDPILYQRQFDGDDALAPVAPVHTDLNTQTAGGYTFGEGNDAAYFLGGYHAGGSLSEMVQSEHRVLRHLFTSRL